MHSVIVIVTVWLKLTPISVGYLPHQQVLLIIVMQQKSYVPFLETIPTQLPGELPEIVQNSSENTSVSPTENPEPYANAD
jgi:hypothetical protein